MARGEGMLSGAGGAPYPLDPGPAVGAVTAAEAAPRRAVGVPLRLGLLGGIWGCSFLFIKEGLAGLSPVQIVLGRLLGGALVLGAVVGVRRVPLPRGAGTWAHLALMGVVANLLPFYLFAWGEQRVPSALAGIYNAATPLLTLLVALVALPEERPGRWRLGGLLIGFAGVLVIISPWSGSGGGSLTGSLACLGAAACYGVAITWTRRFLAQRGLAPLALAFGQLSCATLILLALSPLVVTGHARFTPLVVVSVGALGALGTGVAYLLYYGLIRDAGATTTSTVTYLAPVVAVALGAGVLGERLAWHDLAGAVVVVAGVALAERHRRKPAS